MLANKDEGLSVQIGAENDDVELVEAAVVSAPYAGADAQTVARLGVIGPTRMDYQVNMSGVYAIAAYLSDILGTR